MCEASGSDDYDNGDEDDDNDDDDDDDDNDNNFWVIKSRIMRWAGHVTCME